LRWSSPELLKEKKYSEKSDVWSFAVVSIEIFTREIPFKEYSPLEFALAMTSGKFIPTASKLTLEPLKDILNKCFSFNPNERPNADQLVQSFTQVYSRQ